MQPYVNPPAVKFYDKFLREITVGTLVATAGNNEIIVGHVYRLPDLTKQNLSMGVKDLQGQNRNVQFGSRWGVAADKAKVTVRRVLIIDDSYLDL